MIKLNILRKLNKLMHSTQNERIHSERLVKSKFVYEYIELK